MPGRSMVEGRPSPAPGTAPRTARDYLLLAAPYLARHGIASARLDAEVLLAHVLGISRLELYTRLDQPLIKTEVDTYREALRRRARREPVAYITGVREFYGLPLRVGPGVLVPRPETEFLVERALEAWRSLGETPEAEPPLLIDFGTGSGAIALAVAARAPGVRAVGVERSAAALGYARANAARLGLTERVRWVRADGLEALASGAAWLVVSNPPYVPAGEIDSLAPEIARYEPREALDGGADGLDVCRRLAVGAARVLRPGGRLLVELGSAAQARALLAWMQETGVVRPYRTAETRTDPVTGTVILEACRA